MSMLFKLSGAIIDAKTLKKREAAYYKLMRRLSGGVPCLEGTSKLLKEIANRGEPTFDFEFIGFRPFEITIARF